MRGLFYWAGYLIAGVNLFLAVKLSLLIRDVKKAKKANEAWAAENDHYSQLISAFAQQMASLILPPEIMATLQEEARCLDCHAHPDIAYAGGDPAERSSWEMRVHHQDTCPSA